MQAPGGFLVAILGLSPEDVAAIESAPANRLRRTMNIAPGSALATIGFTMPAVLAIAFLTGETVELGLEIAEANLLLITFLLAVVKFNIERTNVPQGLVHLVLFTCIVLIFE